MRLDEKKKKTQTVDSFEVLPLELTFISVPLWSYRCCRVVVFKGEADRLYGLAFLNVERPVCLKNLPC